MNHLSYAFTGKNSFWRYIIMVIAVFAASNTVGGIPLIVAMVGKAASDPQAMARLAENPMNISVLGINPNLSLGLMLFPFIIALIAFVLLIKPLNGRTVAGTINGTRKVRWNRIFVSAFVWLLLSAIYVFVQMKLSPDDFSLNNTSRTLIPLIIISVLLIPFQAAFEEILFRGYMLQGFAVLTKTRWLPVLLTGLIFGIMHAWNPEVKEYGFLTMMPQYAVFGIIFGIAAVMDDGIETAIGAHAANNVFLSIMVTNSSSALQTPAVFEQKVIHPWAEFWGLLAAGIAFLIILRMIYRWKDAGILFRKLETPEPAVASEQY